MDYSESNASAWNRQSRRYLDEAEFSTDIIDFGDPRCLTDEDLHLVGDVRGKKILELGCGGAHTGINLAKRGGFVTGVDISEKQVAYAREETLKAGVTMDLTVSSIEGYELNGTWDMVISICAFQYVRRLDIVFRRIADHLVPGGTFIFSTDHSVFHTAGYATIWKDEKQHAGYFDENPDVWKWKDEDDYTFTTFRHPVEFYINNLTACGLRIERLHELSVPHEKPLDEEEELESKFPPYLVIKATKTG